MNKSNPNNINDLEQETLAKIKQLAKNSKKSPFDLVMEKLNSSTNLDEKFILMLISVLYKKCSSELLLALLYIVS